MSACVHGTRLFPDLFDVNLMACRSTPQLRRLQIGKSTRNDDPFPERLRRRMCSASCPRHRKATIGIYVGRGPEHLTDKMGIHELVKGRMVAQKNSWIGVVCNCSASAGCNSGESSYRGGGCHVCMKSTSKSGDIHNVRAPRTSQVSTMR